MKEFDEYVEARAKLLRIFGADSSYTVEDHRDDFWVKHDTEVCWNGQEQGRITEENEHTYSSEIKNNFCVSSGDYTLILVRDECGGDGYYCLFSNNNKCEV